MTDDIFEYYTKFHSKETALMMMRNRIAGGLWSSHQAYTYHIACISMLAAETANWQVFIRAHMDIMNAFEERDVNSYPRRYNRNTCIRELEETGIDVTSLLLGATLHISNSATNHYFASTIRLGRAFAEISNKAELEKQLLDMITDEQLDDHNRYLLQRIFVDYVYHLPQRTDREKGFLLLATATRSLPGYMQKKLDPYKYRQNIETGAQAFTQPYSALPEIGFLLLIL